MFLVMCCACLFKSLCDCYGGVNLGRGEVVDGAVDAHEFLLRTFGEEFDY